MKLFHLSDLHLGKRFNGFSLIADQEYILKQILHQIDIEKPDAILIAGDIYDKPIPPAEAISLFDGFLIELSARKLEVFLISGNHDSPERIAFGGKLMQPSGIHVSPFMTALYPPFLCPMRMEPSTFICSPFSSRFKSVIFIQKNPLRTIPMPLPVL